MKDMSITYQSYNPSLDTLITLINQDSAIKNWLSFSKTDSKFIFIDHIFVGFCKLFFLEEDM